MKWNLVNVLFACVCGILSATVARADTDTLYSYTVDEPTDGAWNYPDRAEGGVSSSCSGGVDCGSGTCSSNAPGGRSLLYLRARNFKVSSGTEWTLPSGYAITAVRADVYGLFGTGTLGAASGSTSGGTRIEAANDNSAGWPSGGYSDAWTPTFSGSCKWQAGNHPLPVPAGGWTQAQVRDLQVSIRRSSSSPSDVALYVTSFRLEVDYLPLGTCCSQTTGACSFVIQSQCGSGFLWAAGGTCSPNSCDQPRPCCRPGGVCTMVLQSQCQGVWHSTGVCETTCLVPGRCCVQAACTTTYRLDCAGSWQSGYTCAANPCPQPNCCKPDGTCIIAFNFADCMYSHGGWYNEGCNGCGYNYWLIGHGGPDTNGGSVYVSVPSESCYSTGIPPTGSCSASIEYSPLGLNDWVSGAGTSGGSVDGPAHAKAYVRVRVRPGVVTLERESSAHITTCGATCSVSTTAFGLAVLHFDHDITMTITGAPLDTANAFFFDQSNVVGSKVYAGDLALRLSESVGLNAAGSVVNPPRTTTMTFASDQCRANVDGRPGLSIDDLFIFVNAWLRFAGADYDGSGMSTIDDLFIYINDWLAGCD